MPRKKKVEYVRCECGFKTENTPENGPVIEAGDYCPRCGEQLTEHNELTRQHARPAGVFG